MNRPGRGLVVFLVLCAVVALGGFWVYRMFREEGVSSKKTPEASRYVRVAVVDFRNIAPKERGISDLKNAKADIAMVWGLGKKDFDKLATGLGMVHTVYSRGGCAVMSRWMLARPKGVNNQGLTAEQNVGGRAFKIQCGISQAMEEGMGIDGVDGDLANGFESVLKLKTGLNLGLTSGWNVQDQGYFPTEQGGWVELGWK